MQILSATAARAIFDILVNVCQANKRDTDMFVDCVTREDPHCTEFRFQGKLGFGGKFRNNSGQDLPYIDCYPEDETPERLALIRETNEAIRNLLAAA